MKKYFDVIAASPLFSGIDKKDLQPMLACLSAQKKTYAKGEFLFTGGTVLPAVGMVLCGTVHIVKEDFWGHRALLGHAAEGELFGEAYAAAAQPLTVSIQAAQDTQVLFMDIYKILTVCSAGCTFHTRLVHNFLAVLAQKNLMLNSKLQHMAQRTTREKLLSYLSAQSLHSASAAFTIPYNRQQLADYLCVERSAMSAALCALRDEGLLTFRKNAFQLLSPAKNEK